jgi:hypothetical protein
MTDDWQKTDIYEGPDEIEIHVHEDEGGPKWTLVKDGRKGMRGTNENSLAQSLRYYGVQEKQEVGGPTGKSIVSVSVEKSVSDEFSNKIHNGLSHVPEKVRQKLKEYGAQVRVGKTMLELYPRLQGVQPRGWGKGSDWGMVSGCYSPGDKEVAVTETTTIGPSGRGLATLWHECGHAFDDAMGRISSTNQYKKAYAADVNELQTYEKPMLAYYLQKGEAGRSESVAEIFGCEMASRAGASPGTGSGGDLRIRFRHCAKIVREAINNL